MLIAVLFIIAKDWKQPRCSQKMDKEKIAHTMDYYSSIKNNKFMKFSGKSIELENIYWK